MMMMMMIVKLILEIKKKGFRQMLGNSSRDRD